MNNRKSFWTVQPAFTTRLIWMVPILIPMCETRLPAQTSFSIDWYSVDGGSANSASGTYVESGTIGQPDAGVMSGGNFQIQGGFWSYAAAIQAPGTPKLQIALTRTNSIIVSWPSASTAWRLQENSILNATNWSDVAQTPNDDGVSTSVVIFPPSAVKFYRLIAP